MSIGARREYDKSMEAVQADDFLAEVLAPCVFKDT